MTRLPVLAAALASALAATPLAAAELDARYERMGSLTLTLEGTSRELVIPFDTERDRAYAEQKIFMGSYLTINMLGQTVAGDGTPGTPMVQVTLQRRSGKMTLLSAEIFDEQGYSAPLAMGPDGGEGRLTDFEMTEGNEVTGTVEGMVLRLADYTGDPRVADGAIPQPATIAFSVTLPPLED